MAHPVAMNRLRRALTRTLGGNVVAVVLAYALLFQLLVDAPLLKADVGDPAHLILCSGLGDGGSPQPDAPSSDLTHKCCLTLCRLAGGVATAPAPDGGLVPLVPRRIVIATLAFAPPVPATGRAATIALARGPPRALLNG
ncbi:hypothetical protein MWN34_15135 [Ancylobacter sp. 6x-1]|uniref:DUF2946 domain-containing protein n=1 Tax=Ancylobacter crimeensis TaxID=2579147 RepID=A0ABT0DE76_9HYPH|nr:hypothetical protein [Ancylobacter crimeensis]MCK0198247.1 hypothetical protein [Ancylobacter crimeensis]